MRLDKFLTEMGIASRSQAKMLVKQKRITVNGVPAKKPEQAVEPTVDVVTLDGSAIVYEVFQYFMLYKPAGVLTATEDKKQKTVLDLLTVRHRPDIFPVGRLDKDTEGLLLLTNDGALAHRMLSPKKHVKKVYFARVEGEITEKLIPVFADGFLLSDGTPVLPSELRITAPFDSSITEVELTIYEGKFHQVKRMFETFGTKIVYLKRLAFGPLILDEETLAPGKFRVLTDEERKRLYET